MRFSDLTARSESAMRSVLKFVGERYATACVNPLQEGINNSNVPADFKIGDPRNRSGGRRAGNSTLDRGPRDFAAVRGLACCSRRKWRQCLTNGSNMWPVWI